MVKYIVKYNDETGDIPMSKDLKVITLAALLHDLGKVKQRIDAVSNKTFSAEPTYNE